MRSSRRSAAVSSSSCWLGALQPRGEGVGVGQQQRPGRRELEGARAALDEPGAELALQAADVLGDGGLRQGQLRGRARERARVGDGAEGEQAARVEH